MIFLYKSFQLIFFLGFYRMTLLFKTWIFNPKISNEDNFEPSIMLSSHLQPQTPKTWQTPPKTLEYKIPLYPLALREISDQLTWDLVLYFFRGGPEKKTPCISTSLQALWYFFLQKLSNLESIYDRLLKSTWWRKLKSYRFIT